jgi:hypothetical protein
MPGAGLVGDVEQCAPYLTPIGMSLESGCSGSRCEGEDHFGTTMHGCSERARAPSVADVCSAVPRPIAGEGEWLGILARQQSPMTTLGARQAKQMFVDENNSVLPTTKARGTY